MGYFLGSLAATRKIKDISNGAQPVLIALIGPREY
jgi:hypothetical protein